MKKHTEFIDKFKKKRVLVIGDFILDEYIYGETERVSREAPVLILKHRQADYMAGGGANPLMNIKSLGAEPVAVSGAGTEPSSEILFRMLDSKKINTSFIVRDPGYTIPVKVRIMAGSVHTAKQQIVRIDRDSKEPPSERMERSLIKNLAGLADTCDAVLVSDYGGGIMTPGVISAVNKIAKAGAKVIVDSRYSLGRYRNILTATPNETEAGPQAGIEKYGEEDVKKAGKKLMSMVKSKGMIITRGSRGMMVFERGRVRKIPAFGSEKIVDVSGAGDTVSAITALALACGASLYDAAYLANIGAGIAVMKHGVAAVSAGQMKKAARNA